MLVQRSEKVCIYEGDEESVDDIPKNQAEEYAVFLYTSASRLSGCKKPGTSKLLHLDVVIDQHNLSTTKK